MTHNRNYVFLAAKSNTNEILIIIFMSPNKKIDEKIKYPLFLGYSKFYILPTSNWIVIDNLLGYSSFNAGRI